MNVPSMRQPGAFLPIAMSLAALAMVLGHNAISGVVHEADEGAAAHIFQVLMAAQIPVVAFFAITSLPRASRQTLHILHCKSEPGSRQLPPSFFSPSGELRRWGRVPRASNGRRPGNWLGPEEIHEHHRAP